jgi:hypothetical protein
MRVLVHGCACVYACVCVCVTTCTYTGAFLSSSDYVLGYFHVGHGYSCSLFCLQCNAIVYMRVHEQLHSESIDDVRVFQTRQTLDLVPYRSNNG